MPKKIIYLYVDGFDLEESEEVLTAAFARLAAEWDRPSLMLINDKAPCDAAGHPEDLPEWSLGLNIDADALTCDDIASLFRFTKDLAKRTGHDFVFGISDRQKHVSDDIWFIDANAEDAEQAMMLTAFTKHL